MALHSLSGYATKPSGKVIAHVCIHIYILFFLYKNGEKIRYEYIYIRDYVHVLINECFMSTYNYIHTFISISVSKKHIYIHINYVIYK